MPPDHQRPHLCAPLLYRLLQTLLALLLALPPLPAPAQNHNPDASPANRDPLSTVYRLQRREHSGDSQEVLQRYYGVGQTIFRGTPAFGAAGYGATLLPHTLPAGDYTNRANFPLQLSVQPTPDPNRNPCYQASVIVSTQPVGSATGESCSAGISSFTVTIPAGAGFSVLNANAHVTALATGTDANWLSTGIRFDVERQLTDASGCNPAQYTGLRLLTITDNINTSRQSTETCPETVLTPSVPAGSGYASLANGLLLQIRPLTQPLGPLCYDLTVFNPDTHQTLLHLTQPLPCPAFLDNHQLVILPWTRFSLSGGTALVRLLGRTDGSWLDTAIVFPVSVLSQDRGACLPSANGGHTRQVIIRYLSNINTEWVQTLEEPCQP